MSENKRIRYLVTNHQSQPVELHLATGLIVLGSGLEAEVQESDLATPQLGVLRHKRLVTVRSTLEDLPEASPEKKSSRKKAKTQKDDSAVATDTGAAKKTTRHRSRGRRDSA